MNDLLDQPVGDFDWGPDSRRWVPRRDGDTSDAVAAFWPLVAIAVGTALLALGGATLWAAPTATSLVDQPSPPAAITATPADASAALDVMVVVHVSGHVAEPGVVSVATNSRAADAVAAAGGALPSADLAAINLAARVTDGMQLHVPSIPPPEPAIIDTSVPSIKPSETSNRPLEVDRPTTVEDPPTDDVPTTGEAPRDATSDEGEPMTRHDDWQSPISPELEAFLRSQTGEPSRAEHAPFLVPTLEDNQLDN